MTPSVDVYLARYRALGLSGSPWSVDQIAKLALHLDVDLPPAYRAYLLIAGAEPPSGLLGSDCHGDYLFDLRDWGRELLSECGEPFLLPENAVVFMMHQGYQFWYFEADGKTEDPPVYFFIQDKPAPEQRFERFTDWLRYHA